MAETIRDAASRRVPLIDTDGIELRVLVAETNAEEFTYDGIDNGGERVAKEVTFMFPPPIRGANESL
jgi:hypothetical protein